MASSSKRALAGLLFLFATHADAIEGLPSTLAVRAIDEADPPHVYGGGKYEQRGKEGRANGWLTEIKRPALSYERTKLAEGAPPRSAVIVLPGGGYGGLAIDKEGFYVARWLSSRGVLGFVLTYRCGGGANQHPAPREDVQRAMQIVRSRSKDLGIDPQRIGVMGFSAGGHLAATAATQWVEADPESDDPVERVSSRPDFAVLVYPVISMREGITHNGSRNNLIGSDPDESLVGRMSADEQVTRETPPTFIVHSYDDRVVPIENPLRFAEACRLNGVPVEAHFYETGNHGYGMWATKGSVADWPAVFGRWLVAHELADPSLSK